VRPAAFRMTRGDLLIAVSDKRNIIYSAAFLHGAALVMFTAYSSILIGRYYYNLTPERYGELFLPQVLTVITATLVSSALGRRFSWRAILMTGFGCSLIAMALLIATEWMDTLPVAYPLLLAATAFAGAGFGLGFPSLLAYAESLNPLRAGRRILGVNVWLGVGLAAGPLLTRIATLAGIWRSVPVLLAVLILAEIVLSRSLPMLARAASVRLPRRRVPARFRIYPVLALLYGIALIMCLTWPSADAASASHVHLTFVLLVEGAFWAALVVFGRVLFALADDNMSWHAMSMALFGLVAVAVLVGVTVPWYGLVQAGIYLLAAIACAAFMPLHVRPGAEHLAVLPLAVTGGIAMLFPVGLGLAPAGFHALASGGISQFDVFIGFAIVGAGVGLVLWPVMRGWPAAAYAGRPAADRRSGP
jgi:hypothetical protein